MTINAKEWDDKVADKLPALTYRDLFIITTLGAAYQWQNEDENGSKPELSAEDEEYYNTILWAKIHTGNEPFFNAGLEDHPLGAFIKILFDSDGIDDEAASYLK